MKRLLLASALLLLPTSRLFSDSPPEPVPVSGTLVAYDPGRTLVLRDVAGRETTYALGPGVAVPRDLSINRTITIFVTRPDSGPPSIVRVALGAGAPETPPPPPPSPAPTPTATPPPGATADTRSETEPVPARGGTLTGTVTGYVAGKAIAIRVPGGKELTFYLDPKAPVPKGLGVGRYVTVETEPLAGSSESIVRRVEAASSRRAR